MFKILIYIRSNANPSVTTEEFYTQAEAEAAIKQLEEWDNTLETARVRVCRLYEEEKPLKPFPRLKLRK